MVRNFIYLKEKLDLETDHTLKKGLYPRSYICLLYRSKRMESFCLCSQRTEIFTAEACAYIIKK